MKVKNNHNTHIGFGTTRILPGEVAELPKEYVNTPIVQFFLKKGWLVEVNPTAEAAMKRAEQKTSDLDKELKKIAKMKLEQLRDKATALGIEFTEEDTEAVLIEKITDKLRAE